MANQILDIVRDRRLESGTRLAELTLADTLGVSRTPVRGALMLLAEEGIVRARPKHGFSLMQSWVELGNRVLAAPASSVDDLYMCILRARIAGDLPQSLTQAAFLERFGVNRLVLLKALDRMANEGLIAKNKGHRWTFLPSIDTAVSLENSYQFRLTIEPAVFHLPSFRVDSVSLDRVRSRHLWLLERADRIATSGHELFEIDAQFHELIAGFSENAFFLQAVQHQNRLRRLLEYQGYWNLRRVQNWVKEHLEVIDAILADDLDVAHRRMQLHLTNAHEATTKLARGSSAQASTKRPRSRGKAAAKLSRAT